MDWQGQKLAEELMQYILIASGVVAFLVGYFMSAFNLMLLIYTVGVVLTVLITVPNWPFFNRHPLNWLDANIAESNSTRRFKPKPQAPTKKGGKTSKK